MKTVSHTVGNNADGVGYVFDAVAYLSHAVSYMSHGVENSFLPYLFLFSLICNGFHKLFNFFGVAQEIVFFKLETVAELKYVRNGSR